MRVVGYGIKTQRKEVEKRGVTEILREVRDVWIRYQTRVKGFDMACQTNTYLRENEVES